MSQTSLVAPTTGTVPRERSQPNKVILEGVTISQVTLTEEDGGDRRWLSSL